MLSWGGGGGGDVVYLRKTTTPLQIRTIYIKSQGQQVYFILHIYKEEPSLLGIESPFSPWTFIGCNKRSKALYVFLHVSIKSQSNCYRLSGSALSHFLFLLNTDFYNHAIMGTCFLSSDLSVSSLNLNAPPTPPPKKWVIVNYNLWIIINKITIKYNKHIYV